ncbi:MAG: glutamate--tRNA ligase, partial [Nitrospirae bacterium]
MADPSPFLEPEPRPQPSACLLEPEGSVRVRFAPAPTGPLHVGNARTALFNWLFARAHEGQVILRIEDTDRERSDPDLEGAIMEDLAWLGLDWDEGPDRGGPAGPYRQSERLAIYRAQAETLIADGVAYPCFCSRERLAAEQARARREGRPYRYPGTCRGLPPEEAERRRAAGEACAIRFRVPAGRVAFHDRLRGTLTVEGGFGDPILVRSDGVAAYNFAVVVDDALMGITHVIRGDDHLANTPKQVLLFDALGFPRPDYLHLPPVVDAEGRPLSKRRGDATVAALRAAGLLPEAVVEYLASLGWSREEGEVPADLERLAADFAGARLSHRPARHDPARLRYFQRRHLRHLPPERLAALWLPALAGAGLLADPPGPEARQRLEA